MAVKVQFEIGHTSKLRSKKTVEGFTHDWELYVKGVQQADISAFVEKIIFNLHESFQKPKRVCSKPPFVVQESGYAGFIVFIDIHFRNRDEPKKVQFNYDLDLQTTGPPQHRFELKTFIFDNPSEEYRQRLLKGGGVPVSGVVGGPAPSLNNNVAALPPATSLNHSPGDGHKSQISESKKHKSRPDNAHSNSFANLFGPPITKTTAVTGAVPSKHSPDSKNAQASGAHQSSSGNTLPVTKEKSSKDKEKSSEKSKERSEKKEKHHKQSLNSPHKEGRSESKKSDSSKHEKRDKTEEKSKKDKNRDKDRDRDRDKSSTASTNSNSKRPSSPKPTREHSPHKSLASNTSSTATNPNNANSIPRPSSSNSGKLEELKTSSKSSKDSTGEGKSKESKQRESSSSSSGKKSKKEKRDKDKERDKEKRHEEREKQKLAESQQRAAAKEDSNKANNTVNPSNNNNTNNLDNKTTKTPINSVNTNAANQANDSSKKPDKLAKQDLFKTSDKTQAALSTNATNTLAAPTSSHTVQHNSSEKKSSSGSSLNSNANAPEKDKRSHKHKKKEKNKDKDKDRERDKERDKDKDKERDKDKDKDKEKEGKKEKEAKEKHSEDKSAEAYNNSNQQNANVTKVLPTPTTGPAINPTEDSSSNTNSTTVPNSSINNNTVPYNSSAINSSSSSSSSKSSKNKEKKSKDKSKEEKHKHKSNDLDASESKAKQAKLTGSSSSLHTASSSLSTSSSSSSVSATLTNAITNTPAAAVTTEANNIKSAADKNLNLDLSDTDSLPAASMEGVTALPNESATATTKTTLQPSPIITHSDSSNSSFPDLPLPKQQKPATSQEQRPKLFTAPPTVAAPAAPLHSPASKEPPKIVKPAAKEKPLDKPPKEEEKEKKRRRNSMAVNTFIEPPLKQLKTKEQTKPIREKSRSPSLRNSGSRASISAEASTTFLQPSASPSSTAAAAPLPPPSSAPSAAHSPALSATEAVGNATSATANAATCNSNTTPSSTTNSSALAPPHQLPLDYLSELQELHHKIMTLQDNEDLQHVVELIAATGCYEITTKTFDFDLCKLDRNTVQRLQEFFATSVS